MTDAERALERLRKEVDSEEWQDAAYHLGYCGGAVGCHPSRDFRFPDHSKLIWIGDGKWWVEEDARRPLSLSFADINDLGAVAAELKARIGPHTCKRLAKELER